MIFVFFLFLQDPMANYHKDPKAIWIPLEHPTVDLPLIHLASGEKTNFKKVGQNGFTMILSSGCGVCEKAFNVLSVLGRDYPTTLLFAGSVPSIHEFLKNQGAKNLENVYVVDARNLVPYNIKTVPTILGYENNKLTMAFYGPMDETDVDQLLQLHVNHSRILRKN